uniref:Uncharacterized protein n=1 Tax=Setaria digitata TaxID=48799 RepID=A0A915PD85_9BILA
MTKFNRTNARDGDQRMGDVNLDDFWNADAEKYKCCCRTVHVVRASLFIAYGQMLITFVFALFFTFYYVQAINGRLTPDHWINQLGERYIFTSCSLIGSRNSSRTPLIFASIHCFRIDCSASWLCPGSQFFSHLIGTLFQLWCVATVWRCYGFLGDKKVVRRLGEQLSTTQVAFHYDGIPHEYIAMSQPPPYAETVISLDKQPLTT